MNIFSLAGIEQLYEDEANVDFVSKRRITRHQIGFYTTLDAAEAAMRDWLKLVRHWGWSIFGCEITEHALDEKVDLEKRDYGNIQSMRTYLDTGELNASVDCDTAGVKGFCGSPQRSHRGFWPGASAGIRLSLFSLWRSRPRERNGRKSQRAHEGFGWHRTGETFRTTPIPL